MTQSRPPEVPVFLYWLARAIFRLIGWRAESQFPNIPKFVVVAAPHTSNLDGIMLVFAMCIFRTRLYWMAKHTLFRPPFGGLVRALGGVPINRESPRGAVKEIIRTFSERDRQILVVAPEGTRGKSERWKTGFYYIAQGADVPLVLAYIDYARKVVGVGPTIEPSGDMAADMQIIHEFYVDKVARYPDKRTLPLGDGVPQS
ncbi:MAG: lysophospholipid acyltransferase family protein [Anaerolineae bacterium]|nr:lysophospholipid acyltransferase family protein [Anaerolineae bacterium]